MSSLPPSRSFPSITSTHILTLSACLHLILLFYAHYVDENPSKFGGLKYTDIDWNVVSDGAWLIFNPSSSRRGTETKNQEGLTSEIAQGWLIRWLGLRIGDPYLRPTFRYTPLLPLLLSPTLVHPLIGKLVLVPISLAVPVLLLWNPSKPKPKPNPRPKSARTHTHSVDSTITPSQIDQGPSLTSVDSDSERDGSITGPPLPSSLLHYNGRVGHDDSAESGNVKLDIKKDEFEVPHDDDDDAAAPFWATHLLWTLNPLVLNITTRGSPEATIILLVILFQTCLRAARASYSVKSPNSFSSSSSIMSSQPIPPLAVTSQTGRQNQNQNQNQVHAHPRVHVHGDVPHATLTYVKWEILAGFIYALAISWKLYPVIYFTGIWCDLRVRYGWFGWGVWRFGWVVLMSLLMINGALWSIWGEPFLHHTYLHHLTRLDHRHNFSPYFYPIYLSLFSSTRTTSSIFVPSNFTQTGLSKILYELSNRMTSSTIHVLRHPLTSFLPQTSLVLLLGMILTPLTGLSYTMFLQTVVFVIFNKVCTSQYFIWFLPLLPPALSKIKLSKTKTVYILALWVLSQALWLSTAYQLEFLGRNVFLILWFAGITVFLAGVYGVGEVLDGFVGAYKSQSGLRRH